MIILNTIVADFKLEWLCGSAMCCDSCSSYVPSHCGRAYTIAASLINSVLPPEQVCENGQFKLLPQKAATHVPMHGSFGALSALHLVGTGTTASIGMIHTHRLHTHNALVLGGRRVIWMVTPADK